MLIEDLVRKLESEELLIQSNNYDDIFELYKSNVEYAKLSNAYPVRIEEVIDDVEQRPPFTDEDHKHFLSIYDRNHKLVAVLDIIEGYSFQNKEDKEAIWIGLLKVDEGKHRSGLGSQIIHSLLAACKDNQVRRVQLGVIQKNKVGYAFWTKMGFKTFTEKNNGKYDLFLMEKEI